MGNVTFVSKKKAADNRPNQSNPPPKDCMVGIPRNHPGIAIGSSDSLPLTSKTIDLQFGIVLSNVCHNLGPELLDKLRACWLSKERRTTISS
jgi:hypothetical protein